MKITGQGDQSFIDELTNYSKVLHESDRAIASLAAYVQSRPRKTILVVYGDHLPPIGVVDGYGSTGYIKGLEASLAGEEWVKMHTTPLLIVPNFPTTCPEKKEFSSNFLGTEVEKILHFPLSPFRQKLDQLKAEFPVISNSVLVMKDGIVFNRKTPVHSMHWYCSGFQDYKINQYGLLIYPGISTSVFHI